ncbi:MAG: hypothetical protein LUC93_17665 [Planctomycetaceae bacterium]|nr:hypothetical protein [Planctomycetaceae bacterium]
MPDNEIALPDVPINLTDPTGGIDSGPSQWWGRAAGQRRDNPNYNPAADLYGPTAPSHEYNEEWLRKRTLPGEDSATALRRVNEQNRLEMAEADERRKAEVKRLEERLIYVEPVDIDPASLERRGIPSHHQDAGRAGYTISMMESEADRFDVQAWLTDDLYKTISMVMKSGLPSPEEVAEYEKSVGLPRDLVRDLLPHTHDELTAKAMAKRLVDVYGDDVEAMKHSYVLNQLRGADKYYWMSANAAAKVKFEAALTSRYGDYLAASASSETGEAIGRFADQQIYRVETMGKSLLTQTESGYHGFLSAGAKLLGFNETAADLDRQHEFIQSYFTTQNLDTGNKTSDWVFDTLFIDAPLLYSQMFPYAAFGPRLGGYVRHASMWGSELSSMIDDDVPLYLGIPLSGISAWSQRRIEQTSMYLKFERVAKGLSKSSFFRRPLGSYIAGGVADSVKQFPDEVMQEGVSKVAHAFAYLGTPEATTEGFNERMNEGWDGPFNGGLKATVSSMILMAAGIRGPLKANAKHKQKVRAIDSALDAARADTERVNDPEAFKQTAGKIIENARSFNQDAPAEVYLPAERMDLLVPDAAERSEMLRLMDATEEYSRSRATGADMCIKLEGYTTAIADHPKRDEFQKFIRVDPDGMTVAEAEKSEEIEKRIQAEADVLLKNIDTMTEAELPPELTTLRDDLKQIDGLTAEEVDRLAIMHYAAAKVAAEEEGGTASEWIERINLRVKFADQIKTQQDIDALRIKLEDGADVQQSETARPDAAVVEPQATETTGNDLTTTTVTQPPEQTAIQQAKDMVDAALPNLPPDVSNAVHEVADALAEAVQGQNVATQDGTRQPIEATAADTTPVDTPAPKYNASQAEIAEASKRSKELDRQRMELNALLMKGKTLSGKALAKYGLTAWHPQSVRMRMAAMKTEADGWRDFQNNPALVAKLQGEMSSFDNVVTYYQIEPLGPNEKRYLDIAGKTAENTVVDGPVWEGTQKELRNQVKDFAKRWKGERVKNLDTGKTIVISRNGIDKSLSPEYLKKGDPESIVLRTPQEFMAFTKLPELLEKAVAVVEVGDRKQSDAVDRYFRFYAPVTIADSNCVAQLTVRANTDGSNRFHFHRIQIVEPAGVQSAGSAESALYMGGDLNRTTASTLWANPRISISDVLRLIKSEDYRPIGEDQTPRTFEQTGAGNDSRILGDVTFYNGVTLARLMRGKATFATIAHEMGHVYLDQLQQRVKNGMASEDSRKAYDSLLKLANGKFDRDGVEKVMRHWEAYLREGKAPSFQLVGAFDTFRSWLTGIYEDIRQYLRGESLNDATRSAFDHLLASEKEIQEVRDYYYATRERLENLVVYKPSVKKQIDAKRMEVESDELSRRDKVRIRAFLRAMESREPVRNKAQADVDAMPVYAAAEALIKEGGIDEADALSMVGPETVAAIKKKFGDDVFGGDATTAHIVAGDHGYSDGVALLEAMAEAKGKAQAITQRIREVVEERSSKAREWLAETEAVPGDAAYHSGKRLELMALQLEGLRLVLNETRKNRIERLNLKAVTDAAEKTVGRMLVRDIGQHRRYANAERRHGQEALRAARDGDIQAAYDALEKQMFNHAITAAMFKARERRESFRVNHTFKKMANVLKALHEDYREPFRQLLTTYGVALRPLVREGANGERMVEWVTPKELQPLVKVNQLLVPESMRDPHEFENGGDNIAAFTPDLRDHIAPWLMRLEKPNGLENWRDLTVQQLEDLRGGLALVEEFGKGTLTALMNEKYKTIDEAVKGMVAIMRQQPTRPGEYDTDEWAGRKKNAAESFIMLTTTAETIAAGVDGNPTLQGMEPGALQKWVLQLRDMSSDQVNRLADLREKLEPHYQSLREDIRRLDQELRKNNGQIDGLTFPEVLRQTRDKKKGFTSEIVLAAVLNTGNADNLFQLQNGYEWDDGHIGILRQQLSVKGWEAVQAIWDAMDSLYPDMDKTVFDVTHKHAPKEAAQAITTETADGEVISVKGGYYPLVYDGRITPRQEAYQDISNARSMANAQMVHGSNKPFNGFAQPRARGDDGKMVFKGAPVLSLSPLPLHFERTTRFITHARALWELDRITKDPRFKKAFTDTQGPVRYREFRQWLNYVANPINANTGDGSDVVGAMHSMFVSSILGFNPFAAAKQAYGGFDAWSQMTDAAGGGFKGAWTAAKYLFQGFREMGLGTQAIFNKEAFQRIKNESPYVKARDGGGTKEMRDMIQRLTPKRQELHLPGLGVTINVAKFNETCFKLIQLSDRVMTGTTYAGSKAMALDGHADFSLEGLTAEQREAKAIAFADRMAATQASSMPEDLTPLQRSNGALRFAAVCISGVLPGGNRMMQYFDAFSKGQVSGAQAAGALAQMYLAMSITDNVFSHLYHSLVTGEDDKTPEWWEWLFGPFFEMVNWVPLAREAKSLAGFGARNIGVPAISETYKNLERQFGAVKKANKGEWGEASYETIRATAFWFKVPVHNVARVFKEIDKAFSEPESVNSGKKKSSAKKGR